MNTLKICRDYVYESSTKIIKIPQTIDPHITIFEKAGQCRYNDEMGG